MPQKNFYITDNFKDVGGTFWVIEHSEVGKQVYDKTTGEISGINTIGCHIQFPQYQKGFRRGFIL